MVPEVSIPRWGAVYIPTATTIINAIGTPKYVSSQTSMHICIHKIDCQVDFTLELEMFCDVFPNSKILLGCFRSFHLTVFWIMFENVMSLHRAKATLIGLLEGSRANEWVVTEKLGDILKDKTASKAATKKPRFRFGDRYFSLLP